MSRRIRSIGARSLLAALAASLLALAAPGPASAGHAWTKGGRHLHRSHSAIYRQGTYLGRHSVLPRHGSHFRRHRVFPRHRVMIHGDTCAPRYGRVFRHARPARYFCGPCGHHFHERRHFHHHVHHVHRVPIGVVPQVVVEANFGWVFHD